jgi:hypothetical protein
MNCPGWFMGFDCFFDLVGSLVLLLLGIYSLKIKSIAAGKRPHMFFLAFILMSGSYLVRIFKNINIYFPVIRSFNVLGMEFTYESYRIIPLIAPVSFASRFLFLLGLFILYFLITKSREKRHLPFMIYMLLVLTYLVSFRQVIFYLTAAFLFAQVAVFYSRNTKKSKTLFQKILLSGFVILTVAQVLFLFSHFFNALYAPAAMVQFAGFLLILIDFILLMKAK